MQMIKLTRVTGGESFYLNSERITELYGAGVGTYVCTDIVVGNEQVKYYVKENVEGICFIIRRGT